MRKAVELFLIKRRGIWTEKKPNPSCPNCRKLYTLSKTAIAIRAPGYISLPLSQDKNILTVPK